MDRINESDWKQWRQIKDQALNRLCKNILDAVAEVIADETKSPHDRYLGIYQLIHKRDKDIVLGFDDLRRSNALSKIGMIHSMGFIEPCELEKFSQETRDFLKSIT